MNEGNIYKRTIHRKKIFSAALQKERTIRIYLPPNYGEMTAYPVIYCQDGEQFFNFGRIATHANRLILQERLHPVIIVGVDVDLPLRNEEYDPLGNRFASYCQFFNEEMIPFVEAQYFVQENNRILAGDSLGGTVSLHLALDRPDLYQKIISFSGAFFEASLERIRLETDLSKFTFYMWIGLEEDEVKTDRGTFDFLHMNRTARKLLHERGAYIRYIEERGMHLWKYWQAELPHALRFFLHRSVS